MKIFSERAAENGWVLIAEKPLFITTETDIENTIINATNLATSDIEPKEDGKPTVAPTKLTKRNIFMLKRLDVRDGSHGAYLLLCCMPKCSWLYCFSFRLLPANSSYPNRNEEAHYFNDRTIRSNGNFWI